MRHKIKLDWDELEDAFSNQREELIYYLDLVTGHILLEGEGEGENDSDDEESYQPPTERPRQDDSTRAYIRPPDIEKKIEWLKEFIADSKDLEPELATKLKTALDGENPVDPIREALVQHPEGRDAWYLYRSLRVRDMIDEFLEKQAVETSDAPPWRAE